MNMNVFILLVLLLTEKNTHRIFISRRGSILCGWSIMPSLRVDTAMYLPRSNQSIQKADSG